MVQLVKFSRDYEEFKMGQQFLMPLERAKFIVEQEKAAEYVNQENNLPEGYGQLLSLLNKARKPSNKKELQGLKKKFTEDMSYSEETFNAVVKTVFGELKFDEVKAKDFLGVTADNFEKIKQEKVKEIEKEHQEKNEEDYKQAIAKLREIYNRIMLLQNIYFDETDNNRIITALWTIGTYFYKEFNSYPRLFFNAMKGSGKTRKLKFIESLAWNGNLQANLSEAVLFRTASQGTILLDEAEQISSKDKNALRELLNSGYKKGGKVQRLRKKTTKEGEQQVIESFDLYSPVALANINGLEDVLGDRAISLILEKSNNHSKTDLIEDFKENPIFSDLKFALISIQCKLCKECMQKTSLLFHWNSFMYDTQHTLLTLLTLPTPHTQVTQPTLTITTYIKELVPLTEPTMFDNFKNSKMEDWEIELFNKIKKAKINSRNLELFFPLMVIANFIGTDILDKLIEAAKEKVTEKQSDDVMENRDISLLDFVARKEQSLNFISLKELMLSFKDFYQDEENIITSEWLAKALKRLQLVLDKRRMATGSEVMLNVTHAKEQIKIFKDISEEEKKQ